MSRQDVELLRGAYAEFQQTGEGAFEDFRAEPEEFLDAGEEVLVLVGMGGKGRESGLLIDQQIAHVWKIRDGQIVRVHAYQTWAEGLQAVGLEQ